MAGQKAEKEPQKNSAEIFILDSTVFLESYSHLFLSKPSVTTPHVAEEITSGKAALEFDRARRSGLELLAPKAESVEAILKRRAATEDKMSRADVSVVALALEFQGKGKRAVVVSDDYAVQNLCAHLGLSFLPVSKEGIRKTFEWVRRCGACGLMTNEPICPRCGSTTKYVPRETQK